MKSKLTIDRLYAPSYYPQYLRWPPELIAAQTRPYTAVVMEFTREEGNEVWFVISQTAASHPPPPVKVRLATVKESVHYSLRGRAAFLEAGLCKDGEPCSRISRRFRR